MEYFWLGLWLVLGVSFGSFLNVISLRYHPESSVFSRKNSAGHSRCPHCGKKISAWELIPVLSFLFLRGRCGFCRKKLTWQYPLVELGSGILAVGAWLHLSSWFSVSVLSASLGLAPWWFYALGGILILEILTLLLISLIDLRHYLIPNELVVSLSVLGLLAAAVAYFGDLPPFTSSWSGNYEMVLSPFKNIFIDRLFSVFALGAPFFLLSLFTNGRGMGWGDFKLALSLGLSLGFVAGFLSVLLGFAIGGVFGLLLLALRFRRFGQILPFAPFLALGAALSIFFGKSIISSYFSLFLG